MVQSNRQIVAGITCGITLIERHAKESLEDGVNNGYAKLWRMGQSHRVMATFQDDLYWYYTIGKVWRNLTSQLHAVVT